MIRIYLFTNHFPYGNKETYLVEEVKCLSNYFKVIILPKTILSEKREVPDNVSVDLSYCELNNVKNRLRDYISIFFIERKLMLNEFINRPAVLFSLAKLKKLFASLILVSRSQSLASSIIDDNENRHLIFYSYWSGPSVIGFKRAIKNTNWIKVISRTHGADLYEERAFLKYKPLHKYVFRSLDRIFPISADGKNYLLRFDKRLKEQTIIVSYLGVKLLSNHNWNRNENEFHIFSCSNIIRLKRVDLIAKSILLLSKKAEMVNIKIVWNHFGSGDEENMVKSIIEMQRKNTNLSCTMHGSVSNSKVYQFLINQFVDVFINLSDSEGLPVSMMEAQSFGIPVIATDVGGVSEIVNSSNGFLLNKDTDSIQVAEVLQKLYNLKEEDYKRLRKASFQNFYYKFNADKNYFDFTEKLKSFFV
jgi:glycosyltransferase involved in cell wall biosynthesis